MCKIINLIEPKEALQYCKTNCKQILQRPYTSQKGLINLSVYKGNVNSFIFTEFNNTLTYKIINNGTENS